MNLNFWLARLLFPFVIAAGVMGYSFMQAKHETRDRAYPFPVASVNSTLDDTDLPAMVFGERASTARHWRLDNATSAWALENSEGDEFMRLTAKTTGDAKSARVHYEIEAPKGPDHDKLEKHFKQNSAMVDSYKAALAEQVDAALTRRPFNMANIMGAVTRGSLSQLGMMGATMRKAAAGYQQERDDNIERAYERQSNR